MQLILSGKIPPIFSIFLPSLMFCICKNCNDICNQCGFSTYCSIKAQESQDFLNLFLNLQELLPHRKQSKCPPLCSLRRRHSDCVQWTVWSPFLFSMGNRL